MAPHSQMDREESLNLAGRWLEEAIEDARASGDSVTAIWVLMDRMDQITEEHGPEVHESARTWLLECLAEVFPTARVHRLVGGGMLLILAGTGTTPAELLLARAQDFLSDHPLVIHDPDGEEVAVSLQVDTGMASYPEDGSDPLVLVAKALEEALEDL